ncbi:death-associated protein 1-like [Macrosteles quadrilineatus]|uniref:death-associated protein 1-like n=1 Tax=Macrosteles quadrilineatus TaxID=74068 RepID=UPI0023E26114|nr:death-associated protein 1-like [Macrosteles quadrilineatus]XP_054290394.1 death-associated protein 1-like [Macrosteles quadrilineatus]
MSSEEKELKGGHPPAVKVGKMRISQCHSGPREPCNVVPDDENNAALKVSTSPPKTMTVSGAPVRGHADFPVEAVQSFHEKPLPTHDPRPAHCNKPQNIQQPRRQ